MKTSLHKTHCSELIAEPPSGFCKRIGDSLSIAKGRLREKFELALPGQQQLVNTLIADAEALAWETSFPHLFLPDFAELRLAAALSDFHAA